MTSTKNVARACDSCITKRASWYCVADDAFLCHVCDSSVHSANPLARRHERVHINYSCAPSWHKGFTKKARTPRHGNKAKINPSHVVPEVGYSDDTNSNEERDQEQFLYRVPILDPFVSKLCTTPWDFELDEFSADVDDEKISLLGKGLENQCMGMEELGLIDSKEGNSMVMGREPFQFCFDFGDDHESLVTCEEVEDKVALDLTKDVKNDGELKENNEAKMNTLLLQLDYEAVITAWELSQKSPWVIGDKPDQCWPHCVGTCGMELHHQHYGGLFGGHPAMTDGEREARVSRYREKRRTRLFSKKIRYEVRKLNAEKRPRMKGRFVKRASSFAAPPTFPLLNK